MTASGKINWGIIGCGDVTEIKSGPAFKKVPNSSLVAVMRRDAAKAADYALRHHVPRWYNDAQQLINDPEVNAVYIATPPASHEEYALAAINAGKPVYVEKPMAVNYEAAKNIAAAAAAKNAKLVVAHYRREWPLFKKLRSLLQSGVIGDIRMVRLLYSKPLFSSEELALEKIAWRVNPAIAGGGLFHDLAPHQLDIMYQLFGPVKKISGIAVNQAGGYMADDMVAGTMLFENDILLNGAWCFCAEKEADECTITGNKGTIDFSFFGGPMGNRIDLHTNDTNAVFEFDPLEHVQQPMIEKVVQYFLNTGPNPCTGEEGAEVMRWVEEIVR